MLEVPIAIDQNDFTVDVTLDDEVYTLLLSWNASLGLWHLGFLDADGDNVVLNIPLTANEFLLDPYRKYAVPSGDLFVLTPQSEDPGRTSFTEGSARLIYLTEEENDALQ